MDVPQVLLGAISLQEYIACIIFFFPVSLCNKISQIEVKVIFSVSCPQFRRLLKPK